MTDAVKMAIEALEWIVEREKSASSAAALEMARAATDALDKIAALEQAGEPVAKLHYSGDVMEAVQQLLERGRATLDSEGYLVAFTAEAPLPTLQRLSQDFEAGEAKAFLYERGDSSFFEREMKPAEFYPNWKITPLYAHPPQSRVAAEPVGLREDEQ